MKRIFIPLLAIVLFMCSCNNNKSKNSATGNKDGEEIGGTDTSQVKKEPGDIQQLKEELSKMTALTNDELKAKLPEQLLGAQAADIEVSDAMGAVIASARYKINDSARLKLDIIDCAGPGGAGLFNIQYVDLLDDKESNDDETTFQSIDFNGQKAFESCMKNKPDDCSFTYFSGNRFLVLLQGEKTGSQTLKDLAKELIIK